MLFVFVINYFHYGFKPWDNIRKTLPFALIALTIVLFTQSVQFGGNINFEQQHTLAYWQRPFAWLDSIVFYLYQLIYPYHLSASYTLFPKFIAQQAWFYPLALLPLGLGYWLWLKRKTSPMLVFSVALFVAGFFTTSGLLSFFFQQYSLVTDRYLYFAMLGIALLVASIFKSDNKIKQGLIIGVLIVFTGLSAFRQIPLWQSEFALWSHSVRYELSEQYALENLNAVYANRAVSFHNKGNAFKIAGENERAITYFTKAIDQYPKHFKNRLGMSFNSRGTLLFHQKKYEKSLSDFIQTVKLEPDNNDANVNKILLHSILKQCKQAYIALDFAHKNQVKLQKIRLADLQKRCPKNRPLS
ncbi:hypothetical protein SPONN_866 [uncultured Candidatus Thioglobus sp.]|nr:hypothetical protein SPONN_866 [uncultured Candidatus Thioglobus sp.]